MNVKWVAIVVGIVLVVAVAAGFGGYSMGKNAGAAQALTARNAFLAARGAGGAGGTGGAGGFGGGAGGAGGTGGRNFDPNNFATGQVKSVSGDTVQLSTATDVLTVKLNGQTTIQKQAAGTVSDIVPGERLTIQGTRAADGTFTAQTIQIGRAGAGNVAANGRNGTTPTP